MEIDFSLLWQGIYTAGLDTDICFVRRPWHEMSWNERIMPWEPDHRSGTCIPYESQQDTRSRGTRLPTPVLCLPDNSSTANLMRIEIMSQFAITHENVPKYRYIWIFRERWFAFSFFFFLPIPSEYANT